MPKTNLSLRAIAAGFVIGTAINFVVTGIYGFGLRAVLDSVHGDSYGLRFMLSDRASLIALVLDLFCEILAGWITASFAKQYRLRNAAAYGVVETAFDAWIGWKAPNWYRVILFLFTIPLAMLGGWLKDRRAKSIAS